MNATYRNVNNAFAGLVRHFHGATTFGIPKNGIHEIYNNVAMAKEPSRNGPVIRIAEPVLITYTHPRERVLFNAARDANPFMHVYESLWMLAGRNDVAPLAWYAKQFKEYSDDGKTLNGAYGYRWRPMTREEDGRWFKGRSGGEGVDQLDLLVRYLKADPTGRRAVLQMWNVEDDLLKIGLKNTTELRDENAPGYRGAMECTTGASRDVCCNLSVMFSIRSERIPHDWPLEKLQREVSQEYEMAEVAKRDGDTKNLARRLALIEGYLAGYQESHNYLDMTVINRSNDMIWGMLGANVVHFSFLQEYMAARLGVEVGMYRQFSNNLHVYESNWRPEEWLASHQETVNAGLDYAAGKDWKPFPLVKDPAVFEEEVKEFAEIGWGDNYTGPGIGQFKEPFLDRVALPMYLAYRWYKGDNLNNALFVAKNIAADDWRAAAVAWLQRRVERRKAGVTVNG